MNDSRDHSAFSHLDETGSARMVDVGAKPPMARRAVARGRVMMDSRTVELLRRRALPKGDVLTVAQIAGIQAAKRTGELIPMCHPLPLDHVDVAFTVQDNGVVITASAETVARTGVEMEALTAVSVAALTLYDMAKAVDKSMVIGEITLIEKTKTPLPETDSRWTPPPVPEPEPKAAEPHWAPPPLPGPAVPPPAAPQPQVPRSPALR